MQVNQIQDKREKTKMPKAGFGALDSFLARSWLEKVWARWQLIAPPLPMPESVALQRELGW